MSRARLQAVGWRSHGAVATAFTGFKCCAKGGVGESKVSGELKWLRRKRCLSGKIPDTGQLACAECRPEEGISVRAPGSACGEEGIAVCLGETATGPQSLVRSRRLSPPPPHLLLTSPPSARWTPACRNNCTLIDPPPPVRVPVLSPRRDRTACRGAVGEPTTTDMIPIRTGPAPTAAGLHRTLETSPSASGTLHRGQMSNPLLPPHGTRVTVMCGPGQKMTSPASVACLDGGFHASAIPSVYSLMNGYY
ncbi:hypothetical protein OPV22_026215 [Ensete ventricosum]|uniref:Sushi domain-containing protein n=1 Tax=Ensete ventricosum TaxID=4639 RepID=A0AAV8QJG0_ENSVE|nr:hypothetical protein OPV22_026215 [Ensete ventricosum]